MRSLIRLEDVVIGYENRGILGAVSFSVDEGQFWGILGQNGGGKSTLLKTILGLLPPVSGKILSHEGIVFGYVPQNEKFDPIFPISVEEIVSMGRYSRVPAGMRLGGADMELVRTSMDKTGVGHLKDRTFRSLSGGEKQRALLARAIAGEPDVLVLDEPTASVDVKGEAQIMELVQKIRSDDGLTVLMVSHFLNTVTSYADMIILIDKDSGYFRAGARSDVMTEESLNKFFGLGTGPGQIESMREI
ncbi:MAG TPA: metal ABC transporter ATP-binding protein [Thermodesulfobacteriota bacterium]|nr:metal ABC transporter ATP-binding protein [Thermodesulfobacteriota bacterium]